MSPNRSPVTVKHPPRAKFTFKQEICINQMANFQSQSCNVDASLADAYIWDFGDGNMLSDNNPNPSHKYSTPGIYTVKLTVKTAVEATCQTPKPSMWWGIPILIFQFLQTSTIIKYVLVIQYV